MEVSNRVWDACFLASSSFYEELIQHRTVPALLFPRHVAVPGS